MKIKKLVGKFKRVWNEEGPLVAVGRVFHFIGNVKGRKERRKDAQYAKTNQGDVLFVTGCLLENLLRYRVLHPMEQLELAGLSCAKVYSEDLELCMEDNYKFFVFYRCEYLEEIETFINKAKSHRKHVCFDVDDLIIDVKYTNEVEFVKQMPPETRKLFDYNVMRVGQTLRLCDMATTTTEALAGEMQKVVPNTYINRNVASKEMIKYAENAYKDYAKSNTDKVYLGYFSGSLTHNQDFEIIKPALIQIMEKYNQVNLVLVGDLEENDGLRKFENRIIKKNKVPWQDLPKLIVQVDINLAPLEDTLFNRAKSEIKWIEAALVRVPTIASKVGAFETMIKDEENGFLCDNTSEAWYLTLKKTILSDELRNIVALQAYRYIMNNCTTIATAQTYNKKLENYI